MGDSEKVVGEEKKSWWSRTKEEYQQQESYAYRPEYTVHTMWKPFIGMGIIMLVLGVVLKFFQGGLNEFEWDYTDCCNEEMVSNDPPVTIDCGCKCARTNARDPYDKYDSCKWFDSDKLWCPVSNDNCPDSKWEGSSRWSAEACSIGRPSQCGEVSKETTVKKLNSMCTCSKIVNITENNDQAKWDRDVLLYYGLENFHQNHRQYADSRDDMQLDGRRLNSDGLPDFPSSDCEDPNNTDNSTGVPLPIVPCGAIANSLFNDTVELFMKKRDDVTSVWKPVKLLRTGIAMPFDKKRFNNPVNDSKLQELLEDKIAKPRDWTKNLWELDPEIPTNNGLENEDLIVWMRTSPLANFKKLWRRVDHDNEKTVELKDGLHTGYEYKLVIENNYRVSSFGGRKKVFIARKDGFGNKKKNMSIISFSASMFFSFFGFLFLFMKRLDDKKNI